MCARVRSDTVRQRTDRPPRERYKPGVTTRTRTAKTDLVVVVCIRPPKSCAQSRVMLARVRPTGIFEVLTAAAWGEALGYPADELNGTSLRDLMQIEKPEAEDVVAALLDEGEVQPLDVNLRCGSDTRKRFRLYRRFDSYEEAVFVLVDELPNRPASSRFPSSNQGATP